MVVNMLLIFFQFRKTEELHQCKVLESNTAAEIQVNSGQILLQYSWLCFGDKGITIYK